MRLVNVYTLRLEEFFEEDIPQYAILSHKWGPEELTYKEVAKSCIDTRKQGYEKLIGARRTAMQYQVGHLWIDSKWLLVAMMLDL